MATKFALLLCSGTELMEKGIRREFPAINIPDNVNEKFFISGYLNELSKPYKENTSISFPKKNSSILKQDFFNVSKIYNMDHEEARRPSILWLQR
ncbi:ANL_collapsed_G0042170.mRNA.1.CDS.1 [Saccharomyces cerevisiae]|nr:ANL_collapsed_G0042170.mRNA.1.CDS.1 [Saccharomyces cerevisiae]